MTLRLQFLAKLDFGNVSFEERRNPEYPEKNSHSKDGENQKQTQPAYGVDAEIRPRASFVGGECSHHCAIPCSLRLSIKRHCYQITSPPRMMWRFETKIVQVIMECTGEMVMVKYGKL